MKVSNNQPKEAESSQSKRESKRAVKEERMVKGASEKWSLVKKEAINQMGTKNEVRRREVVAIPDKDEDAGKRRRTVGKEREK